MHLTIVQGVDFQPKMIEPILANKDTIRKGTKINDANFSSY